MYKKCMVALLGCLSISQLHPLAYMPETIDKRVIAGLGVCGTLAASYLLYTRTENYRLQKEKNIINQSTAQSYLTLQDNKQKLVSAQTELQQLSSPPIQTINDAQSKVSILDQAIGIIKSDPQTDAQLAACIQQRKNAQRIDLAKKIGLVSVGFVPLLWLAHQTKHIAERTSSILRWF